ncbi:PilZ domain-containing protein [Cellulomonas citrea]|uniref:PilZ domain-containing protein n=1 Tax=Cellulomonas citrea TaxID=1909423 RepID=UPI0013590F96|nr:PilZ domain-containing protein [Cellulomonas citrea]
MHELARGVLVTATGAQVDGHVEDSTSSTLVLRCRSALTDLAPGAPVELQLLDEVRGEVRYGATVLAVEDDLVEVGHLVQLSVRQRRGAARVRVHMTCRGSIGRAGREPGDDETSVIVSVLDISATGVRLLLPSDLPLGTLVHFEFGVLGGLLPLTARVLRGEESMSGWRYGCELVGLTARQSEQIFRFVLLTQGEQRRRELEGSSASSD